LPAIVALHETVAVPNPVTLLGVIAPQVSPEGMESVRITVPAKWLRAAMVIVELIDVAALAGAGEVAEIVKSWNVKITWAEWVREPLEPVTVSV
jgi:hypothetical protein